MTTPASGLNYKQIVEQYNLAVDGLPPDTKGNGEVKGLNDLIQELLAKGKDAPLSQTDLLQLQALMAQLSTVTTISSQLISALARSLGDLAKNI